MVEKIGENVVAKPLRALLVEDTEDDAELVLLELRRGGYEPAFVRVQTAQELVRALDTEAWDIVLSDYSLPGFSGPEALRLIRQKGLKVPFILISGTVGEETAVEAMRLGVQDYVMKGHLSRLVPAIERELVEASRRKTQAIQFAVTRVLADSMTLEEAAPRLLEAMGRPLGWDVGELWLVDADENALACFDVWQAGEGDGEILRLRRKRRLPPGTAVAGRAWSAGRTTYLADLAPEDAEVRAAAHRLGLTSALGVPILRGVEVIGILGFFARRAAAPDDSLVKTLTDIGSQVGQFVARKKAEEALRESEEKHRTLIESLAEGILQVDAEGNVQAFNPAAQRILGLSTADLLGQAGYRGLPAYRENGTPFPADERPAAITLQTGEPCENTVFGLDRRDGKRCWICASSAPLFRPGESSPYAAVISFSDVSDRRRLEDQIRQTQKMEALGRLAGVVAHDFNNILTTILGFSDLLLGRMDERSPFFEDLGEIRRAAERAAALTSQLLAFSRRQEVEPTVLDLNALVSDVEKMLRRLVGERIDLRLALAPDLWHVRADRGQLGQVLMNLVVNARDAMPDGGTLLVETGKVELDESYARLHMGVLPGPYAMLAVSDTGSGIDPEVLPRIFEPFFTTKDEGKGTGLGLATAFGIVKQGGGHIGVYSEPGRGTIFKVYLPREKDVAESLPSIEARAQSGGFETVLLVEDEEGVRGLASRVLSAAGYTVLGAGTAEEALAIASRAASIHLLVTDSVLPGLSGPKLAQRLRDIDPGLKVVLMSGYTEGGLVRDDIELLGATTGFLQKPFSPAVLVRKVREVLDEGSRSDR